MKVLLLFLISFVVAYLFLPYLLELLQTGTSLKENWQGKKIPTGSGLIFPLVITLIFLPNEIIIHQSLVLFAIYGVALIGLIDDFLGTAQQKGLKGHFYYLIYHKKLSTGMLKALGTGIIAFYLVLIFSEGYKAMFLDWLVLILSVNLINLLDLRPGRALKGALFLLFISAFFISGKAFVLPVITVGIILALLPYDLKGLAMLGDTGSNTLGLLVGWTLLQTPFLLKGIIVLAFLSLHIYAEKVSFTEVIQKNVYLNYLDRLGLGLFKK